MSPPDDPLWRFSLDLYGTPGVGPACLALQDEAGADVNLVLYLLWCAATGRPLDAAAVAEADERLGPWRRSVVEPLRAVRRAMKGGLLGDLETGPLRETIKAAELASERLAQAALFAAAPEPSGVSAPAAARAHLALYASRLARPLPEAALAALLDAFDRR